MSNLEINKADDKVLLFTPTDGKEGAQAALQKELLSKGFVIIMASADIPRMAPKYPSWSTVTAK